MVIGKRSRQYYSNQQTITMYPLLLLSLLPLVAEFLGYNCGGEGLNITTLSLLDIGDSHMNDMELKKEEAYIQLQLVEYDRILP